MADSTENDRPPKRVKIEDEELYIKYEEEEQKPKINRASDMYLDTINRPALDFDFERLCSVTLSHNNIYACLCDGKYFQGRGKNSPAYAHSISDDHHVFINLETRKVYVLPDGYEVNDPSLEDIKFLLYPTYTAETLSRIDQAPTHSFDLAHQPYYPGYIGLNNIKLNSYMNTILQALLHIAPLRDYFILHAERAVEEGKEPTELVKRFGMLCRKVWNPRAYKPQVSPHEFLQECSKRSAGRFQITQSGDPAEFLGWLLNTLHRDLGGTKKPNSSFIYAAFQGQFRMEDQQVLTIGEYGVKPKFDLGREITTTRLPYLFLTLDLPAQPVFQSDKAENIAPQVHINTLLAKYDGKTTKEEEGNILRRFRIEKLPPFVIIIYRRFNKTRFGEEKNGTIVNFDTKGLDFSPYVEGEKMDRYYDLVSNVTHSSAAGTARQETTWKTMVPLKPSKIKQETKELKEDEEKWFQIQDLIVEEINKELVDLAECYIQVWELTGHKHDLKINSPHKKKKK